jgi:hypothetical protein
VRAQAPGAFEQNVRSMTPTAASHVAAALQAYLEAWKESQAAGAVR